LRRCNFHFIFALTSRSNFDLLSAQASGKAVKIRRGRAAVSDHERAVLPDRHIHNVTGGHWKTGGAGKTAAGYHEPENLPAMREAAVALSKPCPTGCANQLSGTHFFHSGLRPLFRSVRASFFSRVAMCRGDSHVSVLSACAEVFRFFGVFIRGHFFPVRRRDDLRRQCG